MWIHLSICIFRDTLKISFIYLCMYLKDQIVSKGYLNYKVVFYHKSSLVTTICWELQNTLKASLHSWELAEFITFQVLLLIQQLSEHIYQTSEDSAGHSSSVYQLSQQWVEASIFTCWKSSFTEILRAATNKLIAIWSHSEVSHNQQKSLSKSK